MRKIIIGMVLGAAIAAGLLIPILIHERHAKFEFGRKNGRIDSLFDAADALDKEFGRYDGNAEYKRLFHVKTTDVISIETNGVKTVRIIP